LLTIVSNPKKGVFSVDCNEGLIANGAQENGKAEGILQKPLTKKGLSL